MATQKRTLSTVWKIEREADIKVGLYFTAKTRDDATRVTPTVKFDRHH